MAVERSPINRAMQHKLQLYYNQRFYHHAGWRGKSHEEAHLLAEGDLEEAVAALIDLAVKNERGKIDGNDRNANPTEHQIDG